jgi:hypothetical protein
MNGNATQNAGGGSATAPLMENEYVKELFGILSDNGRDSSGLAALISHVSSLEDFVKQAEGKISEMKTQLDTMKEIQDHPIKATLRNAIKSLETKVAEIKVQITGLKNNIIDGCKNAVAAFKEKGTAALDRFASFFHIKGGLRSYSKSIDDCVRVDEKAIAKIEVFSKEYHQTGRHLKNMGRVLVGKKPIDAVKESGRLAKAIAAPYRADIAIMLGMKKAVDSMADRIDRLEAKAGAVREARGAKPSMMNKLKENKELIRQKELEKPPLERAPKAQGLEV